MEDKFKGKPSKEIQKFLLELVKDQHILFLENGHSLDEQAKYFCEFLTENKVETNKLFCVGTLPLEYVKDQLDWTDVLVFQTTGTYRESLDAIYELICRRKTDLIVIECCLREPVFGCIPANIHKGIVGYSLDTFAAQHKWMSGDSDWQLEEKERRGEYKPSPPPAIKQPEKTLILTKNVLEIDEADKPSWFAFVNEINAMLDYQVECLEDNLTEENIELIEEKKDWQRLITKYLLKKKKKENGIFTV